MPEPFSVRDYLDRELLRFTTAGSVDDGKSTLIGRLLYDSKSIFEDQLEAVRNASRRRGDEVMDLALITDGLKAEREQGITIDVAYRYFATPKRKFIIADTPGHVQYTRNMVTGASTANLALVLLDVRNGVVEQTRRHMLIASLLRIPHLVVCVNKMDLVDWKEDAFEPIAKEVGDFAGTLGFRDVHEIPMSALEGDNVVAPSKRMPWYDGPTLLELLETIPIASDRALEAGRLPIQYVIRPQSKTYLDYRAYAGRVAGGIFRPGDEVAVLPTGLATKLAAVEAGYDLLEEAFPPLSVRLRLTDDLDASRGDMIVHADALPRVEKEFEAMLCWFSEAPLKPRGKYFLRHTTREVRAVVEEVVEKIDVGTFRPIEDDKTVAMNDIARVRVKTGQPIFFDSYQENRITGAFILIDAATNATVAAGMIR